MKKILNPLSIAEVIERAKALGTSECDASWPPGAQQMYAHAFVTGYIRCWNEMSKEFTEILGEFKRLTGDT
jgi:hypothetical protein